MAGRAQVLLVDDEEDILSSAKAYLEGALPVEVRTATSGPAALALLRQGYAPDLVLSDYRMPAMDGLEFLTQASKLLPDRPLVLMTAYPDMQLAIVALNDARIARFLTKPVDPARLEAEVREMLETSRRARSGQQALRRAAGQEPSAGAGKPPGKPPSSSKPPGR